MASHKEKKETLSLYKLFEGLEDTIIYTVGAEEDLTALPHIRIQSDKTERTVRKTPTLLKKRPRREGAGKKGE